MAELDDVKKEDVRIVKFFDELHKRLGGVPWSECTRIYRELRLHLEELVEAQIAVGCSKSQAIEMALIQIGKPSELGKKMRNEWRLAAAHQTGLSVRTLGEASLCLIFMLVAFMAFTLKYFSPDHDTIDMHNVALVLCAPLIAGIALGVFRPREAAVSMVRATAILYLFFELLCVAGWFWNAHFPASRIPNLELIAAIGWSNVFGGLLGFGAVALTGALPAYLMSAWKLGGLYRLTGEDFRLHVRVAN